jgi:hypothetical protein
VFPCEPGAKRPLTRNGHWDATTDPRIIERWWQRWSSAKLAKLMAEDLLLSYIGDGEVTEVFNEIRRGHSS